MSQSGQPRPVFLIARNPQPDTKLPYLLKLPLEGGPGAEGPRHLAQGLPDLLPSL